MSILYVLFCLALGAGISLLGIRALVRNKRYQAFVQKHTAPGPLSRYPFECPYCHHTGGDLSAGTYCCSECQRTVVFHQTPTDEEAAKIRREQADIDKIYAPSFDLELIKKLVYGAYMNKPRASFISFNNDFAELTCPLGQNSSIVQYPRLDTNAGIQALTHECLMYVKQQVPPYLADKFNEGHGFFSDD